METKEECLRKWLNHDSGRRIAAFMDGKAQSGIMSSCAPVGNKNAIVGGERVIIPDLEVAPLITEAFMLAAESGLTLRALMRVMTEKGLRSRNGRALGESALGGILTNLFYAGMMRY